ncbi:MAG: hypothetical protein ACREDD_01785 [Methylocella sp.]
MSWNPLVGTSYRGRPRTVALDRAIHLVATRYQLIPPGSIVRYHMDEYAALAERFGYANAKQARSAFNKYRALLVGDLGCKD